MLRLGLLFKPNLKDKEIILKNFINICEKLDIWSCELGSRENMLEFFDFPFSENKNLSHSSPNSPKETIQQIDFILCFGGDGTMLRSVEYSIFFKAPVLGVNLGKLGFLSDTSLKELEMSIVALTQKKYRIESRMMLDIKVFSNINLSTIKYHGLALNDAVLFKGHNSKLIDLRLYANRQFVYETRSDGLVISTPTGSTAYSLSAGGPIISPAMQAIVVTPLNPHILSIRPFVFDEDETIEIRIPNDHHIYLQTDGNNRCELDFQDKIIIKKYKETLNFVKLTQKTFYRILRKKLQMGKM
ncbi:MAG: NAD(+)/NADH kinase [Candidatus Cloacimonetes bacterium]|nr:NAD(+)/NADH kinase [Candidatus Cloacimonadota bacterium]